MSKKLNNLDPKAINPNYMRANKPLFMEYFGYDADKKRANLAKRMLTTKKLRKAGFED